MKLKSEGFTLIELIVVLAIMAILGAIAIPSFARYIERAKKQVCNTNCKQLERMYEGYLILENINSTDIVFSQYIQKYGRDICPEDGDISYEDRRVKCRIHNEENDIENEPSDDGQIPFL